MKFNTLLVALAIAAFAFTGCDSDNNTTETTVSTGENTPSATQTVNPSLVDNPMTAAEGASTGNEKRPEMTFTVETHDFGKIRQGDMMKHKFKFKNTGNSDLLITSASGSCGCTVPDWPKNPIPPGGEANIDVEYNSAGKTGMQRVNVTLVANTIPNTKVLTITGEVEVPN